MHNIVVIGASAAGMSFAAKYHRNKSDDNIIVLEKLDRISFGACGLPYFAQGYFNDENNMYARTPKQITDSGIDLRINSTVKEIDFTNKTVYYNESEEVSYDKLIIATGAKPMFIDTVKKSSNVQALTTIEDGKLLRDKLHDDNIKHLTIVGSGFIGMEVLDAAIHHKKQVTLVEYDKHVLSKYVEVEFQEILEKYLVDNNVELLTDNRLESISDTMLVKTDKTEFKTDHVVMCIGFKPNTEMFKQLDMLSNGAIITDQNNETSIKDVYAIGDCATVYDIVSGTQKYIALATVANKQGRSLADKLAGISNTFNGMIGSGAIKILDYDIARTGLTTKECEKLGIDFSYKIITEKTHTSYYPNQEDIHICLIYKKDSLEIIGGQILGKKDVVQRLNTIALAIQKKVTTKELGYIDFAYAPPFSRTWEALNVAGNVSKK